MASPRPNRSLRQFIQDMLRRLRRKDPQPPADPYAYRLAPLRRGPRGRSGAAVAEPEEEGDSFFPPRRQ